MKRHLVASLALSTVVGCLTVPPKAVHPSGEKDRAEETIAEKLPLVTPVPVTADNCNAQLQALQKEIDVNLRRLAAANRNSDEPK